MGGDSRKPLKDPGWYVRGDVIQGCVDRVVYDVGELVCVVCEIKVRNPNLRIAFHTQCFSTANFTINPHRI